MNWIRRFAIPKQHRRMIGQIVNEITKEPDKRNKTDVYWRGVSDGVKLVRKRAQQKGVDLNDVPEPLAIVKELRVDL